MEREWLKNLTFYNQEIKERYLDRFENEATAKTIAYTLQKAESTETFFKQDLYEFNPKQVELVIRDINPASIASARSYFNHIVKYIDWTIAVGYRRSNINILQGIGNDWLQKMVTKKKRFISEAELRSIEDGLENFQDAAILNLAFHGVVGDNCYELSHLKYHHLQGNKLNIHQADGNVRTIEVNDRTIYLIDNAFKQDIYILANGLSKANRKSQPLLDTPYILKNQDRKGSKDILGHFPLMRRLRMLKAELEMPMLSFSNLSKSGMINYAVELSKDSGRFGTDEFWKVAKKYNLSTFHGENGKPYYLKSALDDVLNSENVKKLYDLDIIFDYKAFSRL